MSEWPRGRLFQDEEWRGGSREGGGALSLRERVGVTTTDAEAALWRELRGRRLQGFKFRRQHPIGPYFVDFYCHEARLAVELDGGQHGEEDQAAYDRLRTREIEAEGIRLLRFWNHDVLARRDEVLCEILRVLTADE